MSWQIINADCRDALKTLPEKSVQTCVTSPPYFGLRDYGHGDQIGLEPTPDEFVQALVEVFREVKRVLRDDGTVWLNLGDSYASDSKGSGGASAKQDSNAGSRYNVRKFNHGVKQKDLVGIPWMVAFALRADGWYLRQDIIWAKKNPMPEPVQDRCTKAHEYLFLLSKSQRYFYDADAIKESAQDSNTSRAMAALAHGTTASDDIVPGATLGESPYFGQRQNRGLPGVGTTFSSDDPSTRNKRSVWTVSTKPFSGAHFATFPPDLIEPCILAGAPEKCCAACGAPYARVVEREPMEIVPGPNADAMREQLGDMARTQTGGTMTKPPTSRTLGFEPTCKCNAETTSATVLDPFAGSGTTGMVALRHNRSFVGCELNPEYAELARDRIIQDAPLMNQVSEAA